MTCSFGLICEDAQAMDEYSVNQMGQQTNPGLPRKWPQKQFHQCWLLIGNSNRLTGGLVLMVKASDSDS